MVTRLLTRIVSFAVPAVLAACTDNDTPTAPRAPSFQVTTTHTLSGSVLGPAGNICNSLPDLSPLFVRVFIPFASDFAGSADLTCPDNSYSFALEPGEYLIRVQLPADPGAIGTFPWRTIVVDPVIIETDDVARDVIIASGTPLGGHVTFDGNPAAGVGITLTYEEAPVFAAATGFTGPDGAWSDFFDRSPMVLQGGVRFFALVGCGTPFGQFFLGSQVIQGPPPGGFLFPDEISAINCALKTAPTVAFSHDRTRLVVTPMPGDIGGLSSELFEQFGAGWGVQLLGEGETPQHGSITFSQLFEGGLIVGIRPDRVLTGVSLAGYADCGLACRDFGLDAKLTPAAFPPFGKKKVTWRYSDAPSPDGVGLEVVQRSFDGVPPASYVLFHFIFTNSARTALTFYAGVFMDWDVGNTDFDAFDDVGFTDRGGRLMYMTDIQGSGMFDGTLVFGAPVAGNAILTEFGQSTATIVAATAGDFTIPTAEEPTDHRYIHTLGPIPLEPHRKADIWVAVVSGHDADEFFANVDAATTDVTRRQGGHSDTGEGEAIGATVLPGLHQAAHPVNPRCKRGCEPR